MAVSETNLSLLGSHLLHQEVTALAPSCPAPAHIVERSIPKCSKGSGCTGERCLDKSTYSLFKAQSMCEETHRDMTCATSLRMQRVCSQ